MVTLLKRTKLNSLYLHLVIGLAFLFSATAHAALIANDGIRQLEILRIYSHPAGYTCEGNKTKKKYNGRKILCVDVKLSNISELKVINNSFKQTRCYDNEVTLKTECYSSFNGSMLDKGKNNLEPKVSTKGATTPTLYPSESTIATIQANKPVTKDWYFDLTTYRLKLSADNTSTAWQHKESSREVSRSKRDMKKIVSELNRLQCPYKSQFTMNRVSPNPYTVNRLLKDLAKKYPTFSYTTHTSSEDILSKLSNIPNSYCEDSYSTAKHHYQINSEAFYNQLWNRWNLTIACKGKPKKRHIGIHINYKYTSKDEQHYEIRGTMTNLYKGVLKLKGDKLTMSVQFSKSALSSTITSTKYASGFINKEGNIQAYINSDCTITGDWQ